ncbi:cell wall-binding repeat-containing protein [Buchananella felis]|uniref:cell wall-binding repeat-containing protein n=1 Tax=Buchananella felis TaxID=3231492 RepID=UPI00352854DE
MQTFRLARTVRALAAAMLATSFVGFAALSAPPAQAANNSRVSIRDVELRRQADQAGTPSCVQGPATSGDTVCITWTWDATGAAPKAGDDFFVEVPANIAPDPQTFSPLTVSYRNQKGAQIKREVGTCTMREPASVFPNRILCRFNPAVADLTSASVPITGTGFAAAKIYRENDAASTTFDLNGTETTVAYPGGAPIVPPVNPGYVPNSDHLVEHPINAQTSTLVWNLMLNSEQLRRLGHGSIPAPLTVKIQLSNGHRLSRTEAVELRFVDSIDVPAPSRPARVGTTKPDIAPISGAQGRTLFDIQESEDASGTGVTFKLSPRAGSAWEPDANYQLIYKTTPASASGKAYPGLVYRSSASLEQLAMSSGTQTAFVQAPPQSRKLDPGFSTFEVAAHVDGPAAPSIPFGTPARVSVAWQLPAGKSATDYPGWVPPASNPFGVDLRVGYGDGYYPSSKPFPTGTRLTIKADPGSAQVEGVELANPRLVNLGEYSYGDTVSLVVGSGKATRTTLMLEARPVTPGSVSVGDYVWLDNNGNGLQDSGDAPLPRVKLSIKRAGDGSGVLDIWGAPVEPVFSDSAGRYEFKDLPVLAAGERYMVEAVTPRGFAPTVAGPTNGGGELDSSTGFALSRSPLTQGQSDPTLDFGFVRLPAAIDVESYSGTWSGVVFQNGVPKLVNGEPANLPQGDHDTAALANVLPANASHTVNFTVTNTGKAPLRNLTVSLVASGGPSLTGLSCRVAGADVPSTYGFVALPVNWEFAAADSFKCTATLPPLGAALLHSHTVRVAGMPISGGAQVANSDQWHARRLAAVSVGDFAWFDRNGNGTQDPAEPGLAGVQLRLVGPGGAAVRDVFGQTVADVTTGVSGSYRFTNLPALEGNQKYTVTVVKVPAGYSPTKPGAGGGSGQFDSSTGSAVTVLPLAADGARDITLDFGFVKTPPAPSPSASASTPSQPTASASASVSSSAKPSTVPSASASASVSLTPSASPSVSVSVPPSASASPSPSASSSDSAAPSAAPSLSGSAAPSASATASASSSATASASSSASASASASASVSGSPSASASAPQSTSTPAGPSVSPSASVTPSSSATASASVHPAPSTTASASAPPAPSTSTSAPPAPSTSASASAVPSASSTPSVSASASASGVPSASPSVSSSASSAPAPSSSATAHVPAQLRRAAGVNRVATAIEVAKLLPVSSHNAVLATGRDWPDALASAPLARAVQAPVLLTTAVHLEPELLAVLKQRGVEKVYVVGGTNSVSPVIERQLRENAMTVERVSGPDRFATSVAAAKLTRKLDPGIQRVLVATGTSYPDALAAGSASGPARSLTVLSNGAKLTAEAATYLRDARLSLVAIGPGPDAAMRAAGLPVAARYAGADRYATAALLAKAFAAPNAPVVLSTGAGFADALGGAALAANMNGVLLLTRPDALPPATRDVLGQLGRPASVTITGGTRTVSPAVADQLRALLR